MSEIVPLFTHWRAICTPFIWTVCHLPIFYKLHCFSLCCWIGGVLHVLRKFFFFSKLNADIFPVCHLSFDFVWSLQNFFSFYVFGFIDLLFYGFWALCWILKGFPRQACKFIDWFSHIFIMYFYSCILMLKISFI